MSYSLFLSPHFVCFCVLDKSATSSAPDSSGLKMKIPIVPSSAESPVHQNLALQVSPLCVVCTLLLW